ncbi:unnamed protein product [Moneuplotes crassus]|uniref:Uncharacterized protein n=1 Tax=Euplotes crassus TaxID=5936 RepID=A0AAD1U0Z7_EUPCR|nr:unnamed protein product [Moneuplotes crassus]
MNKHEKSKSISIGPSLNQSITKSFRKKESTNSVSFNLDTINHHSPAKNKKITLSLRRFNKNKRQTSFRTTQEKMDFMIAAYNNKMEIKNALNYSSDSSLSDDHLFKTFSPRKEKIERSSWTKISDLIFYKDKTAFHNRIKNIKKSIQEKVPNDEAKLYSPKNARRSPPKKRKHGDRRHALISAMKAPYHAKHDRGTPSNLNSVYYPSTSIQEGGVESDDNTFDFSIKLRKRLKPKAKRLSPMRINLKAISFKMMKKGMSEALKPIQKQKPEDSSRKHQRSASVRTAKVDNRLAYSLKSESKKGPTVENYMRKMALKRHGLDNNL